jgi:hypothetical protein
MNANEEYLRNQLARQIRGGNAFIKIENVLENIKFPQLDKKAYGLPYSFWQQFEHMRITQRDILDFSLKVKYHPLDWPADYWPDQLGPSQPEQWDQSQKKFFLDREEFLSLLLDPKNDLYKPLHQGETQTLFREALLILEHNAYHTGQLMIISRLLQEK